WVERARASVKHSDDARRRIIQKDLEAEAHKWSEREKEERENAYQLGRLFREKAEQGLKFPLAEVTTDYGKTVIKPLKWTGHTLVRWARVAKDLMTESIRVAKTHSEGRDEIFDVEDYGSEDES